MILEPLAPIIKNRDIISNMRSPNVHTTSFVPDDVYSVNSYRLYDLFGLIQNMRWIEANNLFPENLDSITTGNTQLDKLIKSIHDRIEEKDQAKAIAEVNNLMNTLDKYAMSISL